MTKSGVVFGAPWSLSLKLITTASAGVLIGIAVVGVLNNPDNDVIWLIGMIILPLAILLGAAFFMIRGYELVEDRLFVQRLGWKTEINLAGLQAVEIDPEAMKRSVRTFGNGGLFCFAGKFRNKKLGPYRAFATASNLAVVLRFAEKIIVVTPDDPSHFKARIKNLD